MKQLLIPILSRFLIILAFGTMCAESCAKDPVNPPEEEDNGKPDEGEEGEGLVSFNDFELGLNQGETIEIPLAGEWNLPVKDFAEGDEITIKLRYDAATSWTFVCTEADNTSACRKIYVSRGKKNKNDLCIFCLIIMQTEHAAD